MRTLRRAFLACGLLAAALLACVHNEGGDQAGGSPGAASPSPRADAARADAGGAPGTNGANTANTATGAQPRARPPCIASVTTLPDGKHHAGKDCMAVGCHDGSVATAPKWTVAGTLHGDSSGASVVAGASIEVIDARGEELRLVTASDGNFHSSAPVVYPLRVRASQCPSDEPMLSPVSGPGGCNRVNCHSGSMRIHLGR